MEVGSWGVVPDLAGVVLPRPFMVLLSLSVLLLEWLAPPARGSGLPPSREKGTSRGFHAPRASLAPAACDRRGNRCPRFLTAFHCGSAVYGRKSWPQAIPPPWGNHNSKRNGFASCHLGRRPRPPRVIGAGLTRRGSSRTHRGTHWQRPANDRCARGVGDLLDGD